MKKRIQQHVQDTKRLFIDNKKSDSFANHFAQNVPDGTKEKEVKNHVKVKVGILWKGKALSCVKTFGTKHCKLCSKERIAILNLTQKSPQLAINKCNEVHGACCHQPQFHRFVQSQTEATNPSTDESIKDERVFQPNSNDDTSLRDSHSTILADSNVNKRESETFGYHLNKVNGLIARSELLKPDEPDPQVDPNLNEKLQPPPQEYDDDWVDLSLSDALNEVSI